MYAPFIVDGKVLKENSIIDEVAFQKALARLEKYGKDLPETYGESLHFSMEYYTDTPINSYEDYVYNIEVENNHTYFVGKDGIWVRT
ncbi:hypothetical protein [Moraxella oblonga]|uniref:hypothetical protein n=1 Tax=Moraxella oblonga TaxID=200413 RepID=UPI0008338D50|nr:hypothetical protein [Moraxella oblonga]